MLKVLRGTIDANKEPLFLSAGLGLIAFSQYSVCNMDIYAFNFPPDQNNYDPSHIDRS